MPNLMPIMDYIDNVKSRSYWSFKICNFHDINNIYVFIDPTLYLYIDPNRFLTTHCNVYIWSPTSWELAWKSASTFLTAPKAARIHHFKFTLSWSKFTQIIPAFWSHCEGSADLHEHTGAKPFVSLAFTQNALQLSVNGLTTFMWRFYSMCWAGAPVACPSPSEGSPRAPRAQWRERA